MNVRRLCVLAVGASAAIVLAACGGGNGGATAGNNGPASNSGSQVAYSGQFIDAPIKGLTYAASPSGLTGATDANGAFQFQAGDNVTFSLNVGGSNNLEFGSISPPAPASGSATVFVVSLPNGIQVAQVLQSLNHGTVNAMDVSGLTLTAADVTNLNTYIASGGTVLPANTTDVQMLGRAQSDSGVSPSQFVYSGGATVSQTMTALQQTLFNLQASPSINLSTLLPGKVAFHQGFFTDAGTISADFGIDYFDTNDTIAAVTSNASDTINQSTYTLNTNVLTFTNGGQTDTVTVAYIDSVQGLWTDQASDGSDGAGAYVFLQGLTPSMIAGKTLTVTGALASSCGAVPLQILVDSSGSTYGVQCQGSSQSQGSGTIGTVSTIPGVITLTDSTGGEVYVAGLLAGGSLNSGAVAVVEEPNTVPVGEAAIDGVFGLTAQ